MVGGDAILIGSMTGKGAPEAEMTINEYRTVFYHPEEENGLYWRMKRQEALGIERIKQWWKEDKIGFMKAYFIEKPIMSISVPYYPFEIFDISTFIMRRLFLWYLITGIIGSVIGLWKKKYRNGTLLFLLFIGYSMLMCGIFLLFPRYNAPVIPFLFIMSSLGVSYMISAGMAVSKASCGYIRKLDLKNRIHLRK